MKSKIWIFSIFLLNFIIGCGPSEEEIEQQRKRTSDSINMIIEAEKQKAILEAQQKAEEERLIAEQKEWERQNQKFSISELAGYWTISMTCTNSSCDNTKVGDIRTETWNINIEKGLLVVRVSGNSSTNNNYSGSFDGKNLFLTGKVIKNGLFSDKVISSSEVNLRMESSISMAGKREVINDGPCKIEYTIQAHKN